MAFAQQPRTYCLLSFYEAKVMRKANRPFLTVVCEHVLSSVLSEYLPSDQSPSSTVHVPKRLLAVKVHGLGDTVMVRAILEHLRRRNPEIEIGILAGPATHEILSAESNFRIHLYEPQRLTMRTALRQIHEIRAFGYETVLNYEQGSLAGTAFLRAIGAPVRIGFLSAPKHPKAFFLTHAIIMEGRQSMWKLFVRLTQIVDPGFPNDPPTTLFFGDDATRAWLNDWWDCHAGALYRRVVAMHLGANSKWGDYRRWPIPRFVELAKRLNVTCGPILIILTGTPPERSLIHEFQELYRGDCIDATNLDSVVRTALVLGRCDLLVSGDTGVMHLGSAMGTPTVGLFGPNTPVHWAPVGPNATYVCATKLPCSPCVNTYAGRVPEKCSFPIPSQCMLDITVDHVLKAAGEVVKGRWVERAILV